MNSRRQNSETERLRTVLKISQAVLLTLDLKKILMMACKMTSQVLKADRCSIALPINENTYQIVKSYKRKTSYPSIDGARFDLVDYPHIGPYLLKGRTVHIPDRKKISLSVKERALFKLLNVKTLLAVPIRVARKTIGAIVPSRVEESSPFSSSDLRVCQAIASQVGIAIKNARLIKTLEEEHKELKVLQKQAHLLNERLRYLMFSTSAVIYASKTSGDYGATFITDNVRRVVGYDPKKFIKNSSFWIDHVHPEDVQRILQELPTIFKEGYYTYEYRFRCKNGKYIWMRDEMKLIRDAKGRPIEIVGYWVDITERKQAEQQLKNLTQKIIAAQEEERKRTAEMLHDVVVQDLTAVQLDLKMLQRTPSEKPDQIMRKLKDDEELLSQSLENLRALTADLRPHILDDLGLSSAIHWLTAKFRERTNIKVKLRTDEPKVKFPPEVETTLFRLIQECLTNISKHSRATEVCVLLLAKAKDFQIIVQDNGIGFQPYPVYPGTGLGLLRIKENVELLRGKFRIVSKRLKGTKVIISLPYPSQEA